MLKLLAIVFLLGGYCTLADTCCIPKQWESFLGIQNVTSVEGKVEISGTMGTEHFDFDKKMIAVVTKDVRVIQDYNKKLMYIIAGDYCVSQPWLMPILDCVPENATVQLTYQFGGLEGLVDQYDLADFLPGMKGYMQISKPACMPIAQTQIYESSVVTYGFANITEGIKDPSVFDVPSPPCPMKTDNMVMPMKSTHPWLFH